MFATFRQDVARWVVPGHYSNPDQVTVMQTVRLLYRHLSLRAMAWYRFGAWCRERRIPFFFGFALRHNLRTFGLELSTQLECGGGLYIAHPVGTVISARRIGRNVSIVASVTVGLRNEWSFPTIGDHVFVGAGARVLGGITIGDGAMIGANAVVVDDVPPNATAVGIPARVVKVAGTRVPVAD